MFCPNPNCQPKATPAARPVRLAQRLRAAEPGSVPTAPTLVKPALMGCLSRARLLCSALVASMMPGALAAEPAPKLRTALWDVSYELHSGAGYRDNVLLSPFAPMGSAFVEGSAEITLMRLSSSDHEFFAFASYEDLRYLDDSVTADREQTAMVFSQYRYSPSADWRVGANVQYLFMDQILDASLTEGEFGVIQVQGHSVGARPVVRWKAADKLWIGAEGVFNRQFFRQPLDDYWETGSKLTFGFEYGHKSELGLGVEWAKRDYDTRLAPDRTGVAMAGQGLQFDQWKSDLTHRHHWDADRHWRTQTRIGLEQTRDNGAGYYDYDKLLAAEAIRWQNGRWLAEASGRISDFRYRAQTISQDPGRLKERILLVAKGRVEYSLSSHWKTYAEAEHEISDSNEPSDNYHMTTVHAGLGVEF